eukprot:1856549-Pyramimonas_sp.AAC.1
MRALDLETSVDLDEAEAELLAKHSNSGVEAERDSMLRGSVRGSTIARERCGESKEWKNRNESHYV